MGKVISFVNQKGGAGKTTCSTNFASVLKNKSYKVLFIDFDGQCNSSFTFGVTDYNTRNNTIVDLIRATQKKVELPKKEDYIIKCSNGIDLICCDEHFFSLTEEMSLAHGGEFVLRRFINNEKLKDIYDFIIIDNNPFPSKAYEASIIASDEIIIPCEAEAFSYQGMFSLITDIQNIINNEDFHCENLIICGILIDKDTPNKIINKAIKKNIQEASSVPTFNTAIPMSADIGKSQYATSVIVDEDSKCNVSKAFISFTEEYLSMYCK